MLGKEEGRGQTAAVAYKSQSGRKADCRFGERSPLFWRQSEVPSPSSVCVRKQGLARPVESHLSVRLPPMVIITNTQGGRGDGKLAPKGLYDSTIVAEYNSY